ncbi:hypothetical protein ACP275_07G084100 [Erythranthe tilingii]
MAFRGFQRSVGTQFGAAFPVAGDHILLRYNSYGRRVPQQHHHYVYQQRLWAVGTHPPPPPPPQWSGGGGALPVAGEDSRTQQLLPYYNNHITPPQNYYYVNQDFSNHPPPQQFDYVQEDETLILNGGTVHPRQQQQQHARRNNNAGGGAAGAGLSESQIKKCLKIKIINNSCPNYIDNRAATAGEDEEEEGEVCAICLDDLYCPDQSNNHRNINISLGILVCKHIYHSDCIRNWLRVKNFCPMCKAVAYSP